ncbi:hypothetical protein X765_30680 [Mesorhizobium sp. LSHC440B00]|nr:hypothetical protein X765_30680 [Mesorhizobium sp. LSHC440B00]ESX33513.1 hypothetical protein X764_29355 [Mesorhizobium sp. LSHC440A00]
MRTGKEGRAIELVELAIRSLDGPEPIRKNGTATSTNLLQVLATARVRGFVTALTVRLRQNNFPKVPKRSRRGGNIKKVKQHAIDTSANMIVMVPMAAARCASGSSVA